jgi:DNA-binding CsgD family transcriptional regulator
MGKRGRPKHPDILTPREWEVLALLREGLTNEQIAERLDISLAGAKYHVSEILGKLHVSSREEAASWTPEERQPWWATALAPVAGIWRKAGSSWAAGALAIGAFALVAAGVGVLVWGLWRNEGDATGASGRALSPPNTPLGPVQLTRLSFAPGQIISADGPGVFFIDLETGASEGWIVPGRQEDLFWMTGMSSDGRYVLFTCTGARLPPGAAAPCSVNEPSAWFVLDTLNGSVTSQPVEVYYLSMSPDGETLLGVANEMLVLIDRKSGTITTTEASFLSPTLRGLPRSIWSPDSSKLVAQATGDTYVVNAVDGSLLQLSEPLPDAYEWGIGWSPDGSRFFLTGALTRHPDLPPLPPRAPGTAVFDRNGKRLWKYDLSAGYARWSPDGSKLAVEVSPPGVTPAFALASRLDVLDATTGDTLYRIDGTLCPEGIWTADGSRLILRAFDGRAYIADPATSSLSPLAAFAEPSPLEPNAGVVFSGTGFAMVDLRSGASRPLAETTVDPAWWADHGPRFADNRLVFASRHLGHGGCGEGQAPSPIPELAFQFPPFAD